jgi:hypothetical protein
VSADVLADAFSDTFATPKFRRRPTAIPGDLRIGWRVSAMVLVLDRCRAKTANLEQIHLLTWALRSAKTRELIARWFHGSQRPDDLIVRFDPSMTRTIALCVAGEVVRRNANQTITLIRPGIELASEIMNHAELLAPEKAFLSTLPNSITQRSIQALLEWN